MSLVSCCFLNLGVRHLKNPLTTDSLELTLLKHSLKLPHDAGECACLVAGGDSSETLPYFKPASLVHDYAQVIPQFHLILSVFHRRS